MSTSQVTGRCFPLGFTFSRLGWRQVSGPDLMKTQRGISDARGDRKGGSMSGWLETRTKRSYAGREFGARLALHAERRPPTFLRRPHGRHACACGGQVRAAVRPRPRAGGEPSSCEVLSIRRQRGCAGRCGARRVLQWLRSFGTILAVLAMPLQSAPPTTQVLLICHSPPPLVHSAA